MNPLNIKDVMTYFNRRWKGRDLIEKSLKLENDVYHEVLYETFQENGSRWFQWILVKNDGTRVIGEADPFHESAAKLISRLQPCFDVSFSAGETVLYFDARTKRSYFVTLDDVNGNAWFKTKQGIIEVSTGYLLKREPKT